MNSILLISSITAAVWLFIQHNICKCLQSAQFYFSIVPAFILILVQFSFRLLFGRLYYIHDYTPRSFPHFFFGFGLMYPRRNTHRNQWMYLTVAINIHVKTYVLLHFWPIHKMLFVRCTTHWLHIRWNAVFFSTIPNNHHDLAILCNFYDRRFDECVNPFALSLGIKINSMYQGINIIKVFDIAHMQLLWLYS